jgi:hypothetical protein
LQEVDKFNSTDADIQNTWTYIYICLPLSLGDEIIFNTRPFRPYI